VDHLVGALPGQTPLDLDEAKALIPSWIATREDLDQVEQENILRGRLWARRRKLGAADILDESFVRQLHRHMFGDVWRWAGSYRLSEKNIGVEAWRILEDIGQLLANARYWIENSTYPVDEIAVRVHHRLTQIHPFPNGNGRFSRLFADLLVEALDGQPFTWGRSLAADPAAARAGYIDALHAADSGDIEPLVRFARS
jgi:Fic-DOC domain mobile mystery protein B